MISKILRNALEPFVNKILALIPDKNAREQAKEEFDVQILGALSSLVEGQLDINKEEAKHVSIFVAGWRPAIGWICGIGLLWNFIVQPILMWIAFMNPGATDLLLAPRLELGELMTLLLGMLGLGGLRTYEKRLGIDTKQMGNN